MLKKVLQNKNPGPGTHEIKGMETHTFNKMYKGELEPKYYDEKILPPPDYKVPGPGTYDPDEQLPIHTKRILQPSPITN
jgi:hypothetical protein